MNPDDTINASAARIMHARGSHEMRPSRHHTCRRSECQPICEQDLVNDGRLRPGTRLIHSQVYVCRYGQIHVCSADRCREYIGTHEGVCPISGIYHGHTEGERAYVAPEKRTAHFKRQPMDVSGKGVKRERDALDTPVHATRQIIKLEPNLEPEPQPRPIKRAPVPAPKGGNRRKPVSVERRRDEAEIIVSQLLYSKVRHQIIQQKRDKLEKEKRRAIKAYYTERAGVTFPIWAEATTFL